MKVFISYAGADEKWADVLRARLPKAGIEVGNPSTEIAPGENWGLKYGKGLEASDAMIVLLSPDSAPNPIGFVMKLNMRWVHRGFGIVWWRYWFDRLQIFPGF